jgi:P27 family predicted phage terminase small subunit
MPDASPHDPPPHLSDESARWWRAVTADFFLEAHHEKLLRLACEAWDRAQEARRILNDEGLVVRNDRGNPISHPAVRIEEHARAAFMKAVKALELDTVPESRVPHAARGRLARA